MWQRFTERARRVILLAQEEAIKRSSGAVGSEELLLGLLREEGGVGAQVLAGLSINYQRVAAELPPGSGPMPSSGEPKLMPQGKRVLELAVNEAEGMHHSYVGSEHLLLALLRENGAAAQSLQRMGANLLDMRRRVEEYLGPLDDVSPQTAVRQARIQNSEAELQAWRSVASALKHLIVQIESGEDFPPHAIADRLKTMIGDVEKSFPPHGETGEGSSSSPPST